MLHFLKSNIYYANELSNDIADEVWTTAFPACVNDADAEGIYEGVKLHKFSFADDFANNPQFIVDKKHVMFTDREMSSFTLAWYDSCVKRKAISNCVDRVRWLQDLKACYSLFYDKSNVYEGAIGYYEALALYDLDSLTMERIRDITSVSIRGMDKLNPTPEISWMLADYLYNNRRSVWNKVLTEYIRSNIRGMLYKRAVANRAGVGFPSFNIPLDINMTIDDVDFTNKQAVYYFDNPLDLDFHTNYMYIKRLCKVDN